MKSGTLEYTWTKREKNVATIKNIYFDDIYVETAEYKKNYQSSKHTTVILLSRNERLWLIKIEI